MQVQRITPYPIYSSNRVQRPEAKNPNFGMKIVVEDLAVVNLVGIENAETGKKAVKKIIETFEQNLAERFKKVMGGLNYRDAAKQIFNPQEHIKDWNTIEIKLRLQKENGNVQVSLTDAQNIRGDGEESKEENVLRNLVVALNKGLDDYAKRKIRACVLG